MAQDNCSDIVLSNYTDAPASMTLDDLATYAIYGLTIQAAIMILSNVFLWFLPISTAYTSYIYGIYLSTVIPKINKSPPQKEPLVDIIISITEDTKQLLATKNNFLHKKSLSKLAVAVSWFLVACFTFNITAIVGSVIAYVLIRNQIGKDNAHLLINPSMLATSILFAVNSSMSSLPIFNVIYIALSIGLSLFLLDNLQKPDIKVANADGQLAYNTLYYLIISIAVTPLIGNIPALSNLYTLLNHSLTPMIHFLISSMTLGYYVNSSNPVSPETLNPPPNLTDVIPQFFGEAHAVPKP